MHLMQHSILEDGTIQIGDYRLDPSILGARRYDTTNGCTLVIFNHSGTEIKAILAEDTNKEEVAAEFDEIVIKAKKVQLGWALNNNNMSPIYLHDDAKTLDLRLIKKIEVLNHTTITVTNHDGSKENLRANNIDYENLTKAFMEWSKQQEAQTHLLKVYAAKSAGGGFKSFAEKFQKGRG